MQRFTSQDHEFMRLALELAEKGRFTTSPNPAVGCVLVKHGEIVGKGFHMKAGEEHAEVMALRQAGKKARGATAYITLEPCAHFGRTPPCVLGLIDAGVSKVIAAMEDPNPQVSGQGMQMLRDAGIESAVGLLRENAEALNRGFLKRMRTGLPWVQLKMGMTIDGRTATAAGESKWITGDKSRADVQIERAKASAILSTGATVIADDPSLNVRWEQLPLRIQQEYARDTVRQPIRIIWDFQQQVRPYHRLFSISSPIWLVSDKARNMAVFPEFCDSLILQPDGEQTILQALMSELGKRQINTLWVEAGARLAGALIAENLVDELLVYMAPKLLGDQARGLCHLPALDKLADAPLWQLRHVEQIGDDVKLVYTRRT